MIVYTLTAETKAELVAALVEYGADPRMSGALGRVPREESPLALSGIITAWPTNADDLQRQRDRAVTTQCRRSVHPDGWTCPRRP
jgi:hypothetical protein